MLAVRQDTVLRIGGGREWMRVRTLGRAERVETELILEGWQ